MSKVEPKTFEEKMMRLDEIVHTMSDCNSSLEENLKLYEEGQKLISELEDEINKAKEKINKIDNN